MLNDAGVDLIRCFPNQGLLVWGGRTLGTEPGDIFVAHRRLLHRLVRSIRAVAEPLVFDVNGPELWLTLVRAITTVLLQVYRAGGLAARLRTRRSRFSATARPTRRTRSTPAGSFVW